MHRKVKYESKSVLWTVQMSSSDRFENVPTQNKYFNYETGDNCLVTGGLRLLSVHFTLESELGPEKYREHGSGALKKEPYCQEGEA